MSMSRQLDLPAAVLIFRAALLLSTLGLAAYSPYKYASQLHAISGRYAFLFPIFGLLALAGQSPSRTGRLRHRPRLCPLPGPTRLLCWSS